MHQLTRSRFAMSVTVLALTLSTVGCGSSLRTGALSGAAVGAAVGGIASGSARGAIIGAAIGGAAGAAIGGVMDSQAEDLQDKLPNAQVERVGEGIQVTFDSGILFDVSQANLRAEAQQNLSDLATSLQDYEGTDVIVFGHTDSSGGEEMNQALSERRADAARTYLVGAGLEDARVAAVGRGETDPIADNETASGRQENRRVEIAIFASEDMRADMLRRHGG